MAKSKTATAAPEGTTPVLVLVTCAHGACGTLAHLPTEQVEAAKAAGEVDDTPAAVASAAQASE